MSSQQPRSTMECIGSDSICARIRRNQNLSSYALDVLTKYCDMSWWSKIAGRRPANCYFQAALNDHTVCTQSGFPYFVLIRRRDLSQRGGIMHIPRPANRENWFLDTPSSTRSREESGCIHSLCTHLSSETLM